MGDDGGKPFWIIALIVIAFINWLSETLKKRQAVKRAERDRQEYIRQKANQPAGRPIEEEDPPLFSEDAEDEVADTSLVDFFESLTGRPVRQAEPVAVAPPPVPIQEVLPAPPKLSKEQKEALRRYESRDQKKARRHSNGVGSGSKSIHDLLSTPGAARQAFLLKEILDEPKGLKTD